jgi:hypothetical protein
MASISISIEPPSRLLPDTINPFLTKADTDGERSNNEKAISPRIFIFFSNAPFLLFKLWGIK